MRPEVTPTREYYSRAAESQYRTLLLCYCPGRVIFDRYTFVLPWLLPRDTLYTGNDLAVPGICT